MPGLLRLIHPAPALTVTALAAALGGIIAAQAGQEPWTTRLTLTTLAVAGSQFLTGALNDWADRHRDAVSQPYKPIPRRAVTAGAALRLAVGGGLVQVAACVPLGPVAIMLGGVASASAIAYNLWLSRTPASVVPYLVSFGILPLWVAAGVGVPLERVAVAPILVGPFAAAAHLANALRDFESDRDAGSRNLAQVLGRRAAGMVTVGAALGVGLGVGAVSVIGGRMTVASTLFGSIGAMAVIAGAISPRLLWGAMLVSAACWTISWALSTG